MITSFLSIQDLKARGWTAAMIRTLLGVHDQQRTTNTLGHQLARPLQLYLETRVVHVESTEAFTHARARASAHQQLMVSAHQTRRAWETSIVARYEALPLPAVQSEVFDQYASNQHVIWKLHLQEFYLWQAKHEHLIMEVAQGVRRAAERRMLERYRAAVDQASGGLDEDRPTSRMRPN